MTEKSNIKEFGPTSKFTYKAGKALKKALWVTVIGVVVLGLAYTISIKADALWFAVTNTEQVRMDIQLYNKAQALGNKASADFLGEAYSKAVK